MEDRLGLVYWFHKASEIPCNPGEEVWGPMGNPSQAVGSWDQRLGAEQEGV